MNVPQNLQKFFVGLTPGVNTPGTVLYVPYRRQPWTLRPVSKDRTGRFCLDNWVRVRVRGLCPYLDPTRTMQHDEQPTYLKILYNRFYKKLKNVSCEY